MRGTVLTFAAAIWLAVSNIEAIPASRQAQAESIDPLCPYPSEDLTFLPFPDDCSQYYECYEGIKYVASCPKDMYYDANSKTCLNWQLVSCIKDTDSSGDIPTEDASNPNGSSSSEDGSDPTDNSSSEDGSNPTDDGSTSEDGDIDPLCPYPSEDLTFFTADDCSQYWECYEGKKYLITCPTDMMWNPLTNMCDNALSVNCNRNPGEGSSDDPGSTGGSSDPLCAGQANGSFHPNPTECRRFYECVDGKAIDELCPPSTYWNQAILTCDYTYDVVCNV